MTARIWTPQQNAIFDFVANGNGHGVVEAYAGTGKTTTIVEAMKYLPKSAIALFVAFNKTIATELQSRLPDVEAMTLHSLGLKAIKRAHGARKVDGQAVMTALRSRLPYAPYARRGAVARLVGLAKGSLTDYRDTVQLLALADDYGVELSDKDASDQAQAKDIAEALDVASELLVLQAKAKKGPIDFDDMVWLPIAQRLKIGEYSHVFVDETQDLNPAQLELVKAAIRPGGRIIAIGDRRQAIYGFRGADAAAIPRMIAELEATRFPLSVTYRCPKSVVEEARDLVPDLEAAPEAPLGSVRRCEMPELVAKAAGGDFVLSRTNAPLVKLCYGWLAAGRRAVIRGRDIGAGLAAWFEQHAEGCDATETASRIKSWCRSEVDRLLRAEKFSAAESVEDKAECLLAILDGCDSAGDAAQKCRDMFSDTNTAGAIILSSTHRAKGLEAPRVWLLRDTYLKSRRGRGGPRPPSEEERNLLYVAQTRAKAELIYVHGDSAAE